MCTRVHVSVCCLSQPPKLTKEQKEKLKREEEERRRLEEGALVQCDFLNNILPRS